MEIVTQQLADALEVKVKGRLDNYWGEHLQRNLEQLIRGGFVIITPSDHVKLVIELCHLSPILFSAQTPASRAITQAEPRRFATPAASFELIERSAARPLTCESIGDPDLLTGSGYGPQDCRAIRFPASTFGFGLGAFGHGFEDAQARFGEFLAVE